MHEKKTAPIPHNAEHVLKIIRSVRSSVNTSYNNHNRNYKLTKPFRSALICGHFKIYFAENYTTHLLCTFATIVTYACAMN